MPALKWNVLAVAGDRGSRLVVDLAQSEAAVVRDLDALVERMRGGQERALEELYDATVGKLYALASAILRSAVDTEEIVCETYAYAWANAGRFDASRASFRSAIVQPTAFSALRVPGSRSARPA